MSEQMTAIVLAGGRSRRMGCDKTRLPWGRVTLLEHVVETLRSVADEIIVAVKDAAAFSSFDVRLVEDELPEASALTGLYSALKQASFLRCFVCAADMPFLNPSLIRFLSQELDDFELAMPETPRGLEPLHAVYTMAALPAVEELLSAGKKCPRELVPKLRTKLVSYPLFSHLDPECQSFVNLNTREDYTRALATRNANGSAVGDA